MKMIIADSGATKTDWALIQDEKPVYVRTSGLHPFYFGERAFQESLIKELRASLGSFKPDVICFYGAGCVSDKASEPVRKLLKEVFGDVTVEVSDDLSAVARAFLPVGKRSSGVAAILGTGSSSGLFRGGRLIEKVPSLGFILGDEGGAADIAGHLLTSMLRGAFSRETTGYLESAAGTSDYGQITSQLYGSERPSYWLGRITQRVLKGPLTDEILGVVKARLQAFTDAHLKTYSGFPDYNLVITGGMANALKNELTDVLSANGVKRVQIYGSVITALAEQQIEKLRPGAAGSSA